MRLAALLAGVALAACVDDSYLCRSDAACGSTGRCEMETHRCTIHDEACPSSRRYTAHSEELSNVCYTDNVDPINACAAGQAPARGENACTASVCAALPACCTTGWFEACVQEAQLRCDLRCTTELAISARAGGVDELTTATWTGSDLVFGPSLPAGTKARYLAPAPGTGEPRLAILTVPTDATRASLTVGTGAPIELAARSYLSVYSVDFDRAGTDQIALSSIVPGVPEYHFEVLDLQQGTRRAQPLVDFYGEGAWGDFDHDEFPDLVIGSSNRYRIVENRLQDGTRVAATALPFAISNSPAVRSLEWTHLGRTENLDLVAGAGIVQYHFAPSGTVNTITAPTSAIDCTRPRRVATGDNATACPATNPDVGWTTVARPSLATSTIVIAATNGSGVYAVSFTPEATPVFTPFTVDGCTPEVACATRLIAFAARDLDGDHVLDLIAVDTLLNVWVTRPEEPDRLRNVGRLPTAFTASTSNVEISVTGVPSS